MNRKFSSILFFATVIASMSFGAGPINDSKAITLKFNLSKGSKLNYNMQMSMHISERVMGNNVNVETNIGMGYIFEVVNDSSGWKTLTSTISKMSMAVNAGGQIIKFDTDSAMADSTGPAGIMSKFFGAMKGGKFSFTMDEKGHVGRVFGIKEMMDHIIAANNADNAEMIMQSMGKSFDEANFKQNIEQSFAIYPDKPVKPGDTWARTLTLNSNGLPMKSENIYTLISVEGNNANIKLSSILSAGADSSNTAIKNMTGNTTGEMIYDIPTGVPLSGTLNMKMNMSVNVQGQEMPMNMDIKTTITGKKI